MPACSPIRKSVAVTPIEEVVPPAGRDVSIIERSLSLGENQYLDLDSGEYLSMSGQEAVGAEHLLNQGVDLFLTFERQVPRLPHPIGRVNSLGMALERAPSNLQLQQVSADAVGESLASAIVHLKEPRCVSAYSISGTYAFRTAQGSAGVMRINWHSAGESPKCLLQYRFLPELHIPTGKFSWGPAVGGLQCRLRTQESSWRVGETPTLSLDLRNHGKKTITFVRIAPAHCEVEIDGAWYGWAEVLGIVAMGWSLGPETELNNAIAVKLTDSWGLPAKGNKLRHLPGVSEFWGERLELTAGNHVARIGFRPDEWLGSYIRNETSLFVVSNPVGFEVIAPD